MELLGAVSSNSKKHSLLDRRIVDLLFYDTAISSIVHKHKMILDTCMHF